MCLFKSSLLSHVFGSLLYVSNLLYLQPYRVPIAGKLDACLFDKTGTLTTDELVPVGVLGPSSLQSDLTQLLSKKSNKTNEDKDDSENQLLTPMTKLSHEASLVLAGCHSLVLIDGETTGDPLESAALKSMRWEVALKSGNVVPSAATEKKPAGTPLTFPNSSPSSEIEILCRHHFSSKLQRMSCVVKDVANRKYYSVVKGSPEMVRITLWAGSYELCFAAFAHYQIVFVDWKNAIAKAKRL